MAVIVLRKAPACQNRQAAMPVSAKETTALILRGVMTYYSANAYSISASTLILNL